MGGQISNMAALRQQLTHGKSSAFGKVIDYIIEKVWAENRNLIEKIVYDAYSPEEYQRTMQFYNAWETKFNYNTGWQSVHGELVYAPDMIRTVNKDLAQHTTPMLDPPNQAWNDSREYLADIIYGGGAGALFGNGPWRSKRDVWSRLNKSLEQSKMNKWFREGCKQAGLRISK